MAVGKAAKEKILYFYFIRKKGFCQMKYVIYKFVDGEWYKWGEWTNPVGLANAANSLGLDGFKTKVEVVEEGE